MTDITKKRGRPPKVAGQAHTPLYDWLRLESETAKLEQEEAALKERRNVLSGINEKLQARSKMSLADALLALAEIDPKVRTLCNTVVDTITTEDVRSLVRGLVSLSVPLKAADVTAPTTHAKRLKAAKRININSIAAKEPAQEATSASDDQLPYIVNEMRDSMADASEFSSQPTKQSAEADSGKKYIATHPTLTMLG